MEQEVQGGDEGGQVMQQAAEGLTASAQADMQAADVIAQAGAKEAAALLKQSAELKMQALQALGVGGQAPQAQGGELQNPDVAGTGAQPVTVAGR